MDILAHGLWAAALAKGANLKNNSNKGVGKVSVWHTAFWGIFPDLFAFTIPFAWLIIGPLFGDDIPRMGPPEEGEPPPNLDHWAFRLASLLYNYSHSLIIFAIISIVVLFVRHHSVILSLSKYLDRRPPNSVEFTLYNTKEPNPSQSFRITTKKNPWEILGWPLHILIDIPTHTYQFYPTPFLWPISTYKFDGISWGTPWFMIVNYSSLAIVLITLFVMREKRLTASQKTNNIGS